MNKLWLSALVLAHFTQPTFAANKKSAELDAALKTSKTVGEFVDQIKPHLLEPWANALAKKVEGARADVLKADVKGGGDYLIHSGKQSVAFQVLDTETGRYKLNKKSYTLDPAKTPEQTWDELAALAPEGHVGFVVIGAIFTANALEESRNCGVYGHEMNDACFANDHAKMIATLKPLAAASGKRLGVCGAKDRVEDCLRKAAKEGKLKADEIKDAKAKAYFSKLEGK